MIIKSTNALAAKIGEMEMKFIKRYKEALLNPKQSTIIKSTNALAPNIGEIEMKFIKRTFLKLEQSNNKREHIEETTLRRKGKGREIL
jgi:hypothetical protein